MDHLPTLSYVVTKQANARLKRGRGNRGVMSGRGRMLPFGSVSDLGLADIPARGLHLLAFSLAPGWLSPDPAPAAAAQGALAALALAVLVVAAVRFARRLGSRLATGAAALSVLAVTGALASAAWLGSAGAPLGRGAAVVAPLWWAALALAAAAAAHRLLVERVRQLAAAVVGSLVVIGGAIQLLEARRTLGSDEAMWRRAIELEPAHDRALRQLSASLISRGEHREILRLAERCLSAERQRCGCHGLRILAVTRLRRVDEALILAEGVQDFCGDHPLMRASRAHALALAGQPQQALERLAASPDDDDPLVLTERRHARALALEATGQTAEAMAEAQRAIDDGGGRDALLLAAAVALGAGSLELAARHVDALLEADPDHPDGLYNRALIAHRRDDYNAAREGYLATLRRAPGYAAARYNLAVLTWHRGVRPEARHHVELFLRDYPEDPRGASLKALTSGGGDESAPTWVGVPRNDPSEAGEAAGDGGP